MSARERIAAAVAFVRDGKGSFQKCARHFGMTLDVVKKACAAAGVSNISDWRPLYRPDGAERKPVGVSSIASRRARFF